MDVCRPPLIWVNGSCYRINNVADHFDTKNPNSIVGDVADEYEDDIGCMMSTPEEAPEINDCPYDIEETDSGRYCTAFHVASAFFPIIIGKKGTTKKRIETETKTKITIPKQGIENEDVKVSGDSKFCVAMACNRIDAIVSSSRQRQGFTHFISIPVNTEKI